MKVLAALYAKAGLTVAGGAGGAAGGGAINAANYFTIAHNPPAIGWKLVKLGREMYTMAQDGKNFQELLTSPGRFGQVAQRTITQKIKNQLIDLAAQGIIEFVGVYEVESLNGAAAIAKGAMDRFQEMTDN